MIVRGVLSIKGFMHMKTGLRIIFSNHDVSFKEPKRCVAIIRIGE
jgi:hypothetical protein